MNVVQLKPFLKVQILFAANESSANFLEGFEVKNISANFFIMLLTTQIQNQIPKKLNFPSSEQSSLRLYFLANFINIFYRIMLTPPGIRVVFELMVHPTVNPESIRSRPAARPSRSSTWAPATGLRSGALSRLPKVFFDMSGEFCGRSLPLFGLRSVFPSIPIFSPSGVNFGFSNLKSWDFVNYFIEVFRVRMFLSF